MKTMSFAAIALISLSSVSAQAWNVIDMYNLPGSPGGAYPNEMMKGSDGHYYGTTDTGGASNVGSIFSVVISGTQVAPSVSATTLYSFVNASDGSRPQSALIQDASGNFYGTADQGGSSFNGTVFSYNLTTGFHNLHTFAGGTTDGCMPYGALVNVSGVLYGTASACGSSAGGVLFKLTPSGSSWTYQVVHNFFGGTSDGLRPFQSPFLAADGNLYGTTSLGGASNGGTIYQFNPSTGVYTLVYSLHSASINGPGKWSTFAAVPGSIPVQLYGTTVSGGTHGNGAIYSFKKVGSTWQATVLHSFAGGTTDGSTPQGTLLYSTDNGGSFYGVTYSGGTYNTGMAYNITPGGVYTPILNNLGSSINNPTTGLIWAIAGGANFLLGATSTNTPTVGALYDIYFQ